VVNDAQWLGCCLALDRPDLAVDPRFATNPARVCHRHELADILQEIFQTRPLRWWELALAKHGVPHSRFLDWYAFSNDPQARANGHVSELDTGRWGTLYAPGVPWKFSATPARIGPPPKPAEHTEALLAHPTFEREAQ
jgi:crotonobetainyl-CoA:carnitine CoA-transferase CaiB-like acyl-CoA transferase